MRRVFVSLLVLLSAGLPVIVSTPAMASGLPGDFNGDGFKDLAVGVPEEAIGAVEAAGAVNVLYGAADGLSATSVPDQIFDQSAFGGAIEEGDQYGWALTAGDFDGDGFTDLAIGGRGEDVGALSAAGAVGVLYGSAGGLTAAGAQIWSQDVANVEGAAEANDAFGYALAAIDFNGDGFADLAVGVPGEDVGAVEEAGAVNVIYGSAGGLSATAVPDQIWHRDVAAIEGDPGESDVFGLALAAANLGQGSQGDLAVGAPGDIGDTTAAGAVHVIYGTAVGLSAAGDQLWTQDSQTIENESESGDLFGAALAAANFGKGGAKDLAIGVPGETFGGAVEGGAVNVIYGKPGGLSAVGDQLWHQNRPGIPDAGEDGDGFGTALAAGNLGLGGKADLVVGVPLEDIGNMEDAGMVTVLYGTKQGLSSAGAQSWHQDQAGVPGEAGPGNVFGHALHVANFGMGSPKDLAVGVPGDIAGGEDVAGAVNAIYGSTEGLTDEGGQLWSQDTEDVEGVAAEGDAFGAALS